MISSIQSIGSIIKIVAISGAVISGITGFYYLSGLRADLEQSVQNTEELTDAVQQQRDVIDRMRKEQRQIRQLSEELKDIDNQQSREIDDLRSRFDTSSSGKDRDFARLAAQKPGLVENVINNGSAEGIRCIELASGAERTEEEINATKPSEVNSLCPSLANPKYTPDD